MPLLPCTCLIYRLCDIEYACHIGTIVPVLHATKSGPTSENKTHTQNQTKHTHKILQTILHFKRSTNNYICANTAYNKAYDTYFNKIVWQSDVNYILKCRNQTRYPDLPFFSSCY